jgi:hypothetical protein
LRNISSGGALVECREEIPEGAWVRLDIGTGALLEAEVRWTKGTQFGCQFKDKFNLKLLQPSKPPATAPRVLSPDYLKGGDVASGK